MSGDDGAGSGGSVLIEASELYGSGSIKANGGTGGGGGGRISVKQTKMLNFKGEFEVTAGNSGESGKIN